MAHEPDTNRTTGNVKCERWWAGDAGLPQEAVAVLQEGQLWRYAAGLTANALTAADRAISLERWAAHIHQVCPQSISRTYMLLPCT